MMNDLSNTRTITDTQTTTTGAVRRVLEVLGGRVSPMVSALVLALGACTPVLSGDDEGEDGPPVVIEDHGDGSSTVIIDGRDEKAWVYLDLEALMEVEPISAEDSTLWDVGILRFNVKANSGTSGSQDVGVALVEGMPFDSLEKAPADGYAVDEVTVGPEDMEPEPGYAFDLWYDYDMDAHTLEARDVVYVVRTIEGNYFKVQMLDYYNNAGTAGYVKFKLGQIAAP